MKWYYWLALAFFLLVIYLKLNPFPPAGASLAEKDAWRESPAGKINNWIGSFE